VGACANLSRMAGGQLFPILAVHLVLTALPGAAACLFAARRGVHSVPVLLAIALAASGALAMLSFWAYYADRLIGESLSYLVLIGSIALLAWALRGGKVERSLLRRLATPLALWVLGSAFLVFLGFLHGGESEPLATASLRFSSQLPSDNGMPYFFSTWFFEYGHHGTPPVFPPDWLSSDRPPLQVGYTILQRPLGWGSPELHYQVLGVVLQQLWIVGLWALLVAARVGRVTRALIALTVLVSDLALVNGFYVWPKLLPAAMLLAVAALVITPLWKEIGRSAWGAALVGLLLGAAMMGHGSSVFGIVPIAAIAAIRGAPSWRWLGVAAIAGLLLVGPWSAYQRYGDPPGNRLVKYTLAGVTGVDDRGVLEAVGDSYREAGLEGTLDNKAGNFFVMAGGGPAWVLDRALEDARSGDFSGALIELRAEFFLSLFPAMGLLLIAPVAMVAARRRGRWRPEEWSFALTCFAAVAVGCLLWGSIVFGDLMTRTVIHVGSYLLPILAFCGAVAGLRACFPRFAVYWVAISAALMLAVYVPALDPPRGSSYSLLAALVAAASLAGFAFVALRAGGTGDVDQTSAPSTTEKPTIAASAATSLTVKDPPIST
jgi:hypothetical protein